MLWLVYSCDGEGATDASTFDLEKGELNHFKSSPKTLFPSQANVVKLPPQHLHWNLILHQQQQAAARQPQQPQQQLQQQQSPAQQTSAPPLLAALVSSNIKLCSLSQ